MTVEKVEEDGKGNMVGKKNAQRKCGEKKEDQRSTSHRLPTSLSFFPPPPPNPSSVPIWFPLALAVSPPHTSLFFFTPPSPLLPPFHPPPFPTSAPHPISGSPLNKSWRDNSTIVARVWEPWTETIAVYPSSGTAWTLSFITAGPSLIKSVPQVPQ